MMPVRLAQIIARLLRRLRRIFKHRRPDSIRLLPLINVKPQR